MTDRLIHQHIKRIQKKIKIRFKHPGKLAFALIHASYPGQAHREKHAMTYERLEFFGDAILNFIICQELYRRFPNANEGALSRLRSTLVSRKVLSLIARRMSLKKFILLGKEEKHQAGYQSKLITDALEALIGVMYQDRGLAVTKQFIIKHWHPYLNQKKIYQVDPNPKSTLQEISQRLFHHLPHYTTQPNQNGFQATVRLQRQMMGKGNGKSKQEAEAEAAQDLLKKFRTRKSYSRFWKRDSKSVSPD